MIVAAHTLLYSDDPTATRAFLRDVLRWSFVTERDGDDDPSSWLIFASGPSEVGVHPTSGGAGDSAWSTPRHHELSLICDDIVGTVAELRERGAAFDGDPEDLGFGVGTRLQVPGTDAILLYEPRHGTAYDR